MLSASCRGLFAAAALGFVSVTRQEHLLSEGRRCVYRIARLAPGDDQAGGIGYFNYGAEKSGVVLDRFQAAGEPVVIQRRQYVRVPALQQVTLNDLCGFVVDTHAVNISGGGMLVAAKGDLTPGTELKFSLTLSSKQPPVTGIGEIVRTSEARQLAVAFRQISDLDRDRLIRFLFDRQRRALALTRGDGI